MSKLANSLLLLMIVLNIGKSHSQTLNETKSWIKNKIPTLEHSSSDIDYDYVITFNESLLHISETIKTSFQGQESSLKTSFSIPIKNIGSVSFDEKVSTVWLIVKAKDNLNSFIKTIDNSAEKSTNECILVLGKSVLKDDLRNRIHKAFNSLITQSGGKVVKEYF